MAASRWSLSDFQVYYFISYLLENWCTNGTYKIDFLQELLLMANAVSMKASIGLGRNGGRRPLTTTSIRSESTYCLSFLTILAVRENKSLLGLEERCCGGVNAHFDVLPELFDISATLNPY